MCLCICKTHFEQLLKELTSSNSLFIYGKYVLTNACIQALRVNCSFFKASDTCNEITPEQICIRFQFISTQFMIHEQFALLQPPHTSDRRKNAHSPQKMQKKL